MRAAAPPLLTIFRSRLQGDLLARLLADFDRQWTISELAASTEEPYQTVASEIRRLQTAGLVKATNVGRTKLLQADLWSPYLGPLTDLALMSFGPPLVIAEEFASIDGIERIYIFGSWAARYEGEVGVAPHDVDVMVIGRADNAALLMAAQRARRRLGVEVNVVQRTAEQWEHGTDGFMTHVRSSALVEVLSPLGHGSLDAGDRSSRSADRHATTAARPS